VGSMRTRMRSCCVSDAKRPANSVSLNLPSFASASAPALSSAATVASCARSDARNSGLQLVPSMVRARSALWLSSALAAFRWPFSEAMCSAVHPACSCVTHTARRPAVSLPSTGHHCRFSPRTLPKRRAVERARL
jgi:hypothetical protein